jgi:hypothetical protein
MNKYESDLLLFLDVIKIFAVLAAIPAYIFLISLIASVTLPVYVFTNEFNREITKGLPSISKSKSTQLNTKVILKKVAI